MQAYDAKYKADNAAIKLLSELKGNEYLPSEIVIADKVSDIRLGFDIKVNGFMSFADWGINRGSDVGAKPFFVMDGQYLLRKMF